MVHSHLAYKPKEPKHTQATNKDLDASKSAEPHKKQGGSEQRQKLAVETRVLGRISEVIQVDEKLNRSPLPTTQLGTYKSPNRIRDSQTLKPAPPSKETQRGVSAIPKAENFQQP